jgi:3-phenylpropionate/cinnamic acid dioxygenase small subunit
MNIEIKLQVQDLNARYAQAIDDDKLEAWPDFFTEQGRYRVTTAENFERDLPLGMIYATSRAMLRDRVRSLRDANVYEAQRYRHIVGVPLIAPLPNPPPHSATQTRVNALMPGEGRVGAAVQAQTSFIIARIMHTGETALFATGRYQDRIVLDGGEARFAEKIVILDSRLIDTLLAIPL